MKVRTSKIPFLESTNTTVLFIAGKQDKRIPTEMILKQASLSSRSEVLILDNVGHMGYIEAKDETLKSLRLFARNCFG